MLFAETSSIVKLYLVEADSDIVAELVTAAAEVSATWAVYVEVRAALAAANRAGRFTASRYGAALTVFEADWRRYFRMPVTASIIVAAGALAELHGLRGYNAIHLASAIRLQSVSKEPVQVVTHDRELRAAVLGAGLELLPVDLTP